MSITRTLTVAAAAVAALSLAACEADTTAGSESPTGTTATSQERSQAPAAATAEPAAAAPEIDEDKIAEMAYLSTVKEYTYPSTEEALMVGHMACALLDNGTTASELALEVLVADEPVVPGFLNDELPNFYGAAIGTFCQEHGWQLGVTF